VTVLKAALQAAQDAGPIEKQIIRKQAAIESREKALNNALKRLPLWAGTLEDLDALCCPSRESVDQFELQLGESLRKLEKLKEAKTLMDEADVLRKRIEGIDRDAGLFRQQVKDLVDGLAPDLKEEPQDRAALLLNAGLTKARDLMSRQENLKKQLTTAEAQRINAEKQTADATTRIRSFCREARCENPEDLEAIEKRSRIRQQMISEREDLESRLRDLGGGATVEAFISEAELIAADSIAPELERLADEIRSLEQERSELDQTIGTENAELKRMDGSARAAVQAQEAERLLAKLESDVEKYARCWWESDRAAGNRSWWPV